MVWWGEKERSFHDSESVRWRLKIVAFQVRDMEEISWRDFSMIPMSEGGR
jgi:hypothetical protein